MLAVFLDGGGADALNLAPRERRLHEVTGVHSPVLARPAGAHEHVKLVHEHDDVPGSLDLVDDVLKALLEFTSVFGIREEHAELEGYDALVLEPLRDVPVDDELRESLRDRGLTHARVTHEARVGLAPPDEDAKHPLHLGVAAEHGIQLTGSRIRS